MNGADKGMIMIAGIKSGSGKTLITTALLDIFKREGLSVKAFKCGPDYIDPIFHETVLGIPSKNLDTFFLPSRAEVRESFFREMQDGDLAVIEGVMGLYDGAVGIGGIGSSYELASFLDCPVILVADVKGMGQSMIPMLSGFLKYDRDKLIKGVILNRISDSSYEKTAPLLEAELGIKVFGYLRDEKDLSFKSRYLGLILPSHEKGLKEKLEKISGYVEAGLDLDGIKKLAGVFTHEKKSREETARDGKAGAFAPAFVKKKRHVMVARDRAFCFYYKDNLSMLEDGGGVLDYFSPLEDEHLPEDADVILLGGGYPELFAEELTQNRTMLSDIRRAYDKGVMLVAECGGFMYLQKGIEKQDRIYDMCGVFDGICRDMKKSVRFGYVELYDRTGLFLPFDEAVKGHEFHYWDCDKNGESARAVKVSSGTEYDCCMIGERYFSGFAHLYYPSNPRMISKILA